MVFKNKILLLLLLTGCIFSFNTVIFSDNAGKQKNREEVLAEIEKANAAFKTLKADVVFTRTITLLDYTEISHGEMSYKKPKRLYLEFQPPRDEIDILDGKHIWVYHPAEKQVEKYDINSSLQSSQGVSFFEFGYGESVAEAEKNYDISLISVKEEVNTLFYVLKLIPKDKNSQYSEIRLWIEEGLWLPSKIELYESGGEVLNEIVLNNIKLNKRMSDKRFVFSVPRGVEVIEPLK